MESGSLGLALVVAFVLVTGLGFETRYLLARRSDWYFLAGLPLGSQLVPIPRPPEGGGETATVRWEVSAPNLVRFWADPGRRTAPTGLHGVVILAQGRRGIELDVRWAPPWSPMFAALWFVSLGIVRGEAHFAVPIAVTMVVGMLFVYRERARRAAVELRWAFLSGSEPGPPPEV